MMQKRSRLYRRAATATRTKSCPVPHSGAGRYKIESGAWQFAGKVRTGASGVETPDEAARVTSELPRQARDGVSYFFIAF
jgi:hypothetical protein